MNDILFDEVLGKDEPEEDLEVTPEVDPEKETPEVEPEADKPEPVSTEEKDPAPSADEPKPEENQEEVPEEPTADETRIAELEKINNGLMQAKTASQASKGKAQEDLASTREQLKAAQEELRIAKLPKESEPSKPLPEKLKVEFDDEGKAFIDPANFPVDLDQARKIKDLESKVVQGEKNLEAARVQTAQAENLKVFFAENEGYAEANDMYQEQWNYMRTELFPQYLEANNIPAPTTQVGAIEISASPEFIKSFKSKFPEGNPETIMEAGLYNTKHYARKAFDSLLKKKAPDSQHKQIPTDKPLPLGTAPGGTIHQDDDTLQRYADKSMEDFLLQSPEEDAKMDRLMIQKGM